MKVLFVSNPANTLNPYVSTLVDGLRHHDVEAYMSCDDLWDSDDYDIVHFQWPEAIFGWARTVSMDKVERLRARLHDLKVAGKKIVVTCHNLRPHTIRDEGVDGLYQLVYENSDLFLHMGGYSRNLLASQYIKATHVIVPHHIYDNIYKFDGGKAECQKLLGIDGSKTNILCFGAFRTDEERNFLIQLKDSLKDNSVDFLTPGFFRQRWLSKSIKETIIRIRKIVKYKRLGFTFLPKALDDIYTERYFAACDIVLLQRLSILNSGNLPMGFHAGKVVVGVDDGNVGHMLKETGNPTFVAGDIESAKQAVLRAIVLSRQGQGQKNRTLAIDEWNTAVITLKIKKEYERLYQK